MQLKKVGTFLSSCRPGMRFKGIKKTHRAEVRARFFLEGFLKEKKKK